MARSVDYGGNFYPSRAALARAIGVSRSTITKAIKAGKLDRVRALAPGEKPYQRVHVRNRQPCAAHGFEWRSQRDCAEEFGISESYLCKMLTEGKFDRFIARKKGIRV